MVNNLLWGPILILLPAIEAHSFWNSRIVNYCPVSILSTNLVMVTEIRLYVSLINWNWIGNIIEIVWLWNRQNMTSSSFPATAPPPPPSEDTPLQRPRPPEQGRAYQSPYYSNNSNSNNNPWVYRLSQRASTLFHNYPVFRTYHNDDHPKRKYSCREMICVCLVPCLVIALFLIALSTLTTYFGVKQVL